MNEAQQKEEHHKLAELGEIMTQFWGNFAAHHAAKAKDPITPLLIPEKPKPPEGVIITISYHA